MFHGLSRMLLTGLMVPFGMMRCSHTVCVGSEIMKLSGSSVGIVWHVIVFRSMAYSFLVFNKHLSKSGSTVLFS